MHGRQIEIIAPKDNAQLHKTRLDRPHQDLPVLHDPEKDGQRHDTKNQDTDVVVMAVEPPEPQPRNFNRGQDLVETERRRAGIVHPQTEHGLKRREHTGENTCAHATAPRLA